MDLEGAGGKSKHSGRNLLDVLADLGRNGAAFAALGEIVVDIFPLDWSGSLTAKKAGVKLGESALNVFFTLPSSEQSPMLLPGSPLPIHDRRSMHDRLFGVVSKCATYITYISQCAAGLLWCCCSNLSLRTCSSHKS